MQHEKNSDSSDKPVGLYSLNQGFTFECPALCLSQLCNTAMKSFEGTHLSAF